MCHVFVRTVLVDLGGSLVGVAGAADIITTTT